MYAGVLQRACYWIDGPGNMTQVEVRPCGWADSAHHCGEDQECYSDVTLPEGWPDIVAPFNGTVSFDNAGLAYYAVIIIGTMEGWSGIQEALDDAVGGDLNWIFTGSLVLFGGYIFVSMLIGALTAYYVKRSEFAKNEAIRKWSQVERRSSHLRERVNSLFRRSKGGSYSKTAKPWNGVEEEEVEEVQEHAPSHFSAFRATIYRTVRSTWFLWFMLVVVVVNTVVLAMDRYPIAKARDGVLKTLNYTCVAIFAVESGLELFGRGIGEFRKSPGRNFDALVTLGSIIEVCVVEIGGTGFHLSLSIFRSWRLLRLMRFSSQYAEFVRIGKAQLAAIQALGSLMVLIVTFLVITSLLGMQIFGGKFWSRVNYDNFPAAFITSFQLQTCENWNDALTEGIQATGGPKQASAFAGLFFVFVVSFGHYILFGVLVAIAYRNLDEALPNQTPKKLSKEDILWQTYLSEKTQAMIPKGQAYFLMLPTSWFRQKCWKFMSHKWFDEFILVCIILASIVLAVEDYRPTAANVTAPSDSNASDFSRNDYLWFFDVGFTVIFVLEFCVKSVALGFVGHEGSYLRNAWNVLDFFIVVTSVASLVFSSAPPNVDEGEKSSLDGLKALRAFRVLRPLKMVETIEGLKRVVETMLSTFTSIWGLLLSAAVFIFSFAVVGVSLFKGRFGSCSDGGIGKKDDCFGNFTDHDRFNETFVSNRKWSTPYLNFDTVGKAFEALVSMVAFEEWPALYHTAADSHTTRLENGLVENWRPWVFLYFFSYLVVIALFFVNVVMAFVVLKYEKQNQIRWLRTGLTGRQAQCLRYALQVKQPVDKSRSRRHLSIFKIVVSEPFELFVYFAVCFNVITLLMHYHGANTRFQFALEAANYIFVGVHCLELILKLWAHGPRGYWASRWNRFDVLLVIGGIFDCATATIGCPTCGLRLFRTIRVGKLFQHQSLRRPFASALASFWGAAWVLAFTGLLFFIYAVIGMNLFSDIEVGDLDDLDMYATAVNARTNFQNLPAALRTLFRSMTGENWPSIMALCSKELWHAPLFFISFVLLTNLLLINVMVAVIMSTFEGVQVDPSELQISHLREFVTKWKYMDPAGTGYIHHDDLPTIMRSIEPPLGMGSNCPKAIMGKFLASMPVPVDENGLINFRPTLVSVIRVKMNMWMYNFPQGESLRDTFKFVAPGASDKALDEATPPMHGMTLRILHMVSRIQNMFRKNKKIREEKCIPVEEALARAKEEREVEVMRFEAEHEAAAGRGKVNKSRASIRRSSIKRGSMRRGSMMKGTRGAIKGKKGLQKSPIKKRGSMLRPRRKSSMATGRHGPTDGAGEFERRSTSAASPRKHGGSDDSGSGIEGLSTYATRTASIERRPAGIHMDEIIVWQAESEAAAKKKKRKKARKKRKEEDKIEETSFGFGNIEETVEETTFGFARGKSLTERPA
jgi:hypothetical protein